MAVRLKVPTIFRRHTGGEAVVEGQGQTLKDLLADLDRRHEGFMRAVVTDDGSLHRFVNVYLNDEDVRYLGGLETELRDGDVVSILPAVAGGFR
ncbi:MAG TPA: MoaD family protein [Actinomycetota bacterium]|nr:MoaD family protein [Actinomycetota bacterium]